MNSGMRGVVCGIGFLDEGSMRGLGMIWFFRVGMCTSPCDLIEYDWARAFSPDTVDAGDIILRGALIKR